MSSYGGAEDKGEQEAPEVLAERVEPVERAVFPVKGGTVASRWYTVAHPAVTAEAVGTEAMGEAVPVERAATLSESSFLDINPLQESWATTSSMGEEAPDLAAVAVPVTETWVNREKRVHSAIRISNPHSRFKFDSKSSRSRKPFQ